MNATSVQNEGGLVAAVQELETTVLQNGQNVEVILTLGQKCCAEIHKYFEISPHNVPVKAVLDAIVVLKRAISCIAERATTSEQKLSTLKHEFWDQSLFPTINSCCFNESWHIAFIQKDSTPEHSLHATFQATIRDTLKEQLIPFISNGIASQTQEAGGLCLVPSLGFILDLATTAAELIGWRDTRAETAPYLRNYGLVNAVWMGVVKFWSSVPQPLRSQLANHRHQENSNNPKQQWDLSANSVIGKLLDFLCKDFNTVCEKQLAADAKLLLFWTVQISKMLAAYSEMALPVWKELWNWIPTAHAGLLKLERGHTNLGAEGEATQASLEFIRAVNEGSLWQRLARLQGQAFHLMPESMRNSCIDELRQQMYNIMTSSNGDSLVTSSGAWCTFSTIVELLGEAKSVPATSRTALIPLFKETMLCIPTASFDSALNTTKLRENVAESILVFVLSLASSAAAEQGAIAEGAQHAWEDCQVILMECSMIPHPYMLNVMSIVWSSLVSVSNDSTTKHFVAAMHDLLTATASTEAGAAAAQGAFKPASPTTQQLTHLLGVLLASVPKQMAVSFYERFLKLDSHQDGDGVVDLCQLAALSAVLRAASLSTHTVPFLLITNLIIELRQCMEQGGVGFKSTAQKKLPTEVNQPILPTSINLYLPWALDCLRASLEVVESYYLDYVETSMPVSITDTLTGLAKTCLNVLSLSLEITATSSTSANANAQYVPVALRTLYLAWKLLPEHPPNTSELETLASCMERFLHTTPAAAAAIAELTPALSPLSTPPKFLFEALLGPSSSAALQFLGSEAYVKYAKGCSDENVLGALPRQWLDPSGTKLSENGQPVMEKYLARNCSTSFTSSSTIPGQKNTVLDMLMKKEVEKVARDAAAGLAAMKMEAMEISAKMVREQHANKNDINTATVLIPSDEVDEPAPGLHSAALHVMEAVENLQKIWVPLTKSSGEDAVGALKVAMQARTALTALLDQK